jgi:hypothetical protein
MIHLHDLEPLLDLLEPHLHGPVLLLEKFNVLSHSLSLSHYLHVLILLFLDCTVQLDDLGFCCLHIFFVLVLKFNYFRDQKFVFVLDLAVQKVFLLELGLQILYSIDDKGGVSVWMLLGWCQLREWRVTDLYVLSNRRRICVQKFEK